MAYYNANEVIRLTRKAMGLTQEQLCEGICEVVTLSRIENGHSSVKRSTYKKLMEKMGRIPETRYAVCVSKDGVLSEDRVELERAFKRYDYETAEYYLRHLKENADDNLLTRQYIIRTEALVDYRLERIDIEEYVKRLEEAIRQTVPMYEQYLCSKRVFPFTILELYILSSLAGSYRTMNEMKKSVKLYETILSCLETKYIGDPDNGRMQIAVRNNLSMVYEEQDKYQEAIAEIDKCLELVIRYDYGYALSPLLCAKAFNMIRLIEENMLGEKNIEEAKKLSQQAYYIAAARGEKRVMKSIEEFWNNYFIEVM